MFTDDELRRITTRVFVVIDDRDVIYRGGPQAALARAQNSSPTCARNCCQAQTTCLPSTAPSPLSPRCWQR